MPKLSFKTSRGSLSGDKDAVVVEIAFKGLVDAANFSVFEKAMEQAAALDSLYLVVQFSDVHYINSTGISVLIRHHDVFGRRKGIMVLAAVSKEVGLSMHLLGVTSLIPFVESSKAALEHIRKFRAGEIEEPGFEKIGNGRSTSRVSRPAFRDRKVPSGDRGRVLVIAPSESQFTNVLEKRFGEVKNGSYFLMHDAQKALESYDTLNPDIVVVDDRCDPSGEFVSRLKVQKERSLTSVIKTYAKDTDVAAEIDFKIWENDFLVDPFDVFHFFSLTEAELERVPKDREVFHQQVHFEFRACAENVEKAHRLSDLIIRGSLRTDDEITKFYAAVKEGIDNAVTHGCGSSESKRIDVNFLVDHKKVTVIIEDQGEGFDFEYYLSRVSGKEAFDQAKKRIIEEGVRGGLGILLMSKCSDRLEYTGSGSVLRLEKNL